jgi:hypothetical protein
MDDEGLEQGATRLVRGPGALDGLGADGGIKVST